ncbi:PLP-dependent cysteine synthase family protein [Curtobacterium pusillum]|uniref:PLP-dependent cysteine synthase family protein n=1 Tax=Curtobacterium pusillum TaxID=69373 RepID=UPI0037F94D58
MPRFESLADAVGGTPLIRLTRTGLRPRIYVKTEWTNPAGSVKDRAALSMLQQALADGSLAAGGTVVETTSGNTGIGLAAYAAHLGLRSVVFTGSSVSKEKRDVLAAYGADVRLVDAFVPKSHPDSLRSVAERFVADTPGAWLAGQYDNPANPAAHVRSTGPEIWADTDGQVTHLVATIGTGGTISGTGRFLADVSGGRVQVVGADPATSIYSGGDGSQKAIEGAGHFVHPDAETDPWPESFDPSVIDRYEPVDDTTAIRAIHDLARTEGILAGGSSGVALAAAYRVAEGLTEDDLVVVLLPDSGRNYLSTYFDPTWLTANGFDGDGSDGDGSARDGDAPRVGDLVTAPLRTAERDAITVAAVAALGPADGPVAVLHPRPRTAAPHPADVAGWTTAEALRTAAPDTLVGALAEPVTARVGAGEHAATAVRRVAGSTPDWRHAVVLDAGRVTGLVARTALEQSAEQA